MAPAAIIEPVGHVDKAANTAKYAKLANELEELAKGGPIVCEDKTRVRLLEAIKAALPQTEHFGDAYQRIVYTPLEITGARIGIKSKVFRRLVEAGRPLTTAELAEPLGANPALFERLLKYISSLHQIKEVDVGLWAPSTTTHFLAQRGMEGAIFHSTINMGQALHVLPEHLESNNYQIPTVKEESAFSVGMGVHQGFFDWIAEREENMTEFNHCMTAQRYASTNMLNVLPFKELVLDGADPEAPLFVDVGGGIGHKCKELLKSFPELVGRTVLQDQPFVVAKALPLEGVTIKGINFFEGQPTKGARAYYLRNILHDWTDELCLTILQHIKEAMTENSVLLIDEMVLPMKGAHKIAMQVDMIMLSVLISEERSERRWYELMDKAGFNIERIYTYDSTISDSIIVARPVKK